MLCKPSSPLLSPLPSVAPGQPGDCSLGSKFCLFLCIHLGTIPFSACDGSAELLHLDQPWPQHTSLLHTARHGTRGLRTEFLPKPPGIPWVSFSPHCSGAWALLCKTVLSDLRKGSRGTVQTTPACFCVWATARSLVISDPGSRRAVGLMLDGRGSPLPLQ